MIKLFFRKNGRIRLYNFNYTVRNYNNLIINFASVSNFKDVIDKREKFLNYTKNGEFFFYAKK